MSEYDLHIFYVYHVYRHFMHCALSLVPIYTFHTDANRTVFPICDCACDIFRIIRNKYENCSKWCNV